MARPGSRIPGRLIAPRRRFVLPLIAALLAGCAGSAVRGVHPEPDSEPPVTTSIGITFGPAMQAGSVEARFSVDPPVSGQLAWDDSTLVFIPDFPLSPATTYTVTLAAGAQTAAGRGTEPLTWSFRPRQPGVLYLAPADADIRAVWSVPADASSPPRRLFHPGGGVLDFAPAPDGSRIAVTVQTADGRSDLWLVDADGSSPYRLFDCAPDSCSRPAWSPDGGRLAYQRREPLSTPGPEPVSIWLYDLESGVTAPLDPGQEVPGSHPVWSPDGQRLAFYDQHQWAIRVLDLASGESVLVPGGVDQAGLFAPDGRSMVYADIRRVGRQFFTQLFVADLAGEGDTAPLLEDAQNDEWPTWSPDGAWLAFGRRRLDQPLGVGSQMVLYNPATGDLRPVTGDPRFNHLDFRWDPGGRYILFTRVDLEAGAGLPEIWLYDSASPDGELTRLAANAFGGQWLP